MKKGLFTNQRQGFLSTIKRWDLKKFHFPLSTLTSLLFFLAIWISLALFFSTPVSRVLTLLSYLPKYRLALGPVNLNSILAAGLLISLVWMSPLFIKSIKTAHLEISFFEKNEDHHDDPPKETEEEKNKTIGFIKKYCFNLPFYFSFLFAILTFILLLVLRPACEVPGVLFTIRVGNGQPKEYTALSEVSVDERGAILIYAKEYPTQKDLVCTFKITDVDGILLTQINRGKFVSPCVVTLYPQENHLAGKINVNVTASSGEYCVDQTYLSLRLSVK